MPTAAHQALLLWTARKMAWDGYRLAGYHGRSPQGGAWNELPPPPIIGDVRPDAWGYDLSGTRLALGETKTAEDIDTAHTRLQLRVFALLRTTSGLPCRLYIAVPRSAARVLDRVMAELGLAGAREIVRIHVPDMFLTEGAAA